MGNESIVIILDASPTMLAPYPTTSATPIPIKQDDGCSVKYEAASSVRKPMMTTTTRLDCAKNAIQMMLTDMMIRGGKDNTAAVLVLKTKGTRHHLVPLGEDDDSDGDNSSKNGHNNNHYQYDLGDIPFANITDLGGGMKAVSPQLLRDLQAVQPEPPEVAANLQGDLSDGITLAVDLMHSQTRTAKTKQLSKRQRKIVLVTDAAHVVQLDMAQILHAMDGLRDMECPLHVLGLGFGGKSVEYTAPLPAHRAVKVQIKQEDNSDNVGRNGNDSDHEDSQDTHRSPLYRVKRIKMEPVDDLNNNNNDDGDVQLMPDPALSSGYYDEILVYNTQKDREELLISLTEKTGGSVVACSNMQHILNAKVGRHATKCTLPKVQICLAPGLTITCRSAKLLDRKANPKLETHAVVMMPTRDEDDMEHESFNVSLRNTLGQERTIPIQKATSYYQAKELYNLDPAEPNEGRGDGAGHIPDKEEANVPVSEDDRVPAVRYGRDLLVRPKEELDGIKLEPINADDDSYDPEKPNYRVLGYVPRSQVPPTLLIGPPYALLGYDSLQACSLLAAIAQALQSQYKVAICTNLKSSRSSEPVLGALFPFQETPEQRQLQVKPVRLLFFQLPFCDDIQVSDMRGFEHMVQAETSDDDYSNDMYLSTTRATLMCGKDRHKKNKLQLCEDMIDTLMLPKDALCHVPYPYSRSFYITVVNRAINRKTTFDRSDIHAVREDHEDFMFTPRDILERAKPILQEFREAFPIKKKKKKAAKKGKGRTTLYHDDVMEE